MKSLILVILIFASTIMNAQETLSLEQCINLAIENNVDIQINTLRAEQTKIRLQQAQISLMPNLSYFSSIDKSFGRSFDPSTDAFVNSNIISSSQSLSGQFGITNAFLTSSQIKASRQAYLSSVWSGLSSKRQLKIQVLNYYSNLLTIDESIVLLENQSDNVSAQIDKLTKLFEYGKVNKEQILNLELNKLKVEQEKRELENNRVSIVLEFKQLVGKTESEEFFVKEIELAASESKVYNFDVQVDPNVQQQQSMIEFQTNQLKALKLSYMPSLSLNFAAGSFYSDQSFDFTTGLVVPYALQLENTFNYRVGVSMAIPLFNGFSNRFNIQNTKIELDIAKKQKVQAEQQSALENKRMLLAIDNASQQLEVAKKEVELTSSNMQIVQAKYDKGLVDYVVYSDALTNNKNAAIKLIQAKYDLYFKAKILEIWVEQSKI